MPVQPIVKGEKGDPGPPGPAGPPGPKGDPGNAAEITPQQMQTIIAAVIAYVDANPDKFRGKPGDKGDPGQVDIEQIVKSLPPVVVQLMPGEKPGDTAKTLTAPLGEPIEIPPVMVRVTDSKGNEDLDVRQLGDPLRIKFEKVK